MLRTLDLHGCEQVNDTGVCKLAEGCSMLQSLFLSKSYQFNDDMTNLFGSNVLFHF